MPIIPLWGGATKGKSSNVTAQRRVNLYAEPNEDKLATVLYSRPGLVRRYFTGENSVSSFPGGPIRGAIGKPAIPGGGVYGQETVFGAQQVHGLFSNTLNRFSTGTDFYLTSSGPVQFASLGVGTVAVDGVTGYMPGNATTMQQEGVSDFPAARSICTLAQRYIVDDPTAVGRFRWSEVDDPVSWPSLNFATAESADDPLSLVFSIRGELLLFGTKTLEFWQPSSDPDLPFQPVLGATAEWGLGLFDTVRDVGGSCMFVGRAGGAGQPQVCLLDGYTVKVVSTPDVDYDIGQELAAGAVPCATVVTHSGHTWYVLNMLTTSFAFDLLTGQWSEWQTEGARWCGQYTFTYRGITFVTDYRDGRVYTIDADTYKDDTAPIVRELTSRHMFHDLDRLTVWELTLDAESGVGLTEGQGSDPQIMLQVSKDGGHTFGSELWTTLGRIGQYLTRVSWRRLGRGRDFVFRFRVSDPVKVVLIGASIRAE